MWKRDQHCGLSEEAAEKKWGGMAVDKKDLKEINQEPGTNESGVRKEKKREWVKKKKEKKKKKRKKYNEKNKNEKKK